MQDANSVITQATHGHVEDLAKEFEVGIRRMYEMLGDQCVYPKAKRLIRAIARVNPDGAMLIKADIDAMFADIFGQADESEVTAVKLHKEAFEAIDAVLDGKPASYQLEQLRELDAVVQLKISGIEKLQERNRRSA